MNILTVDLDDPDLLDVERLILEALHRRQEDRRRHRIERADDAQGADHASDLR